MNLSKFALAAVAAAFVMSSTAVFAADILAPRAPASAKGVTNPVASSADSVSLGEELFQEIGCNGCHGDDGAGAGPASAGMDPAPRNFTNGSWQAARTDGELRHTIFQGSDGTAMIANQAMFDEEDDVWHVVNFIRSLKK